MSRPVVLGNGELHVGINRFGEVHDFYYPYVGFENHAAGKDLRHHIGVWVNGVISWLDDGSWKTTFSYPHDALIGHTVAVNDALKIILEFDDAVDTELNGLLRSIHVINNSDEQRDVRLFLHQAFVIGDARSYTDTAQYLPDVTAILHYRGRRAFVIAAEDSDGKAFDQFSIGLFGIEGREGTYRDADDGELSGCPVEQGRVDSTIRFKFSLGAHASTRVRYWIACGTSTREALYVHKQLRTSGIDKRLEMVAKWWYTWLKPAYSAAAKLNDLDRGQFIKSVMIMKAHIDKRGAVIASTDTSMLDYWRDAYAYCWPRDAAYVLWPLIRMGYKDEPYRFFEFCRRALNPGGFLMHKYRADGTLGSSWHPYVHENGVTAPPIQEDETALTLFVFSQFYHISGDDALLREFYEPMVVPMANFLASYIDERTNLPKPSYDLWEEMFMTTTYTTAVTYAALLAAADLAELRKDADNAVKWRAVADDMATAAQKNLYNEDRQMFYKGITVAKNGDIVHNDTYDMSSVFGAFMFGLFPTDSDQIAAAIQSITSQCNFDSSLRPGIPRYENDGYLRHSEATEPNWWFVTSLWVAQYFLETNRRDDAMAIVAWVRESAWSTGILAEQVDATTRSETSLSPLCWSQAEYVSTLLDTITDK